jgi:hypothetical protein
MQGLRVRAGPDSLRDLLGRWSEAERLFWYLDFYQGPFWCCVQADEDSDRLVEAFSVDVPSFRDDPARSVWRPGTFPRLASDLMLDEWSCLIGLAAREEHLPALVAPFAGTPMLSEVFFASIERLAQVGIVYVERWWEAYTLRLDWLAQLQQWYGGEVVDSGHWRR